MNNKLPFTECALSAGFFPGLFHVSAPLICLSTLGENYYCSYFMEGNEG